MITLWESPFTCMADVRGDERNVKTQVGTQEPEFLAGLHRCNEI